MLRAVSVWLGEWDHSSKPEVVVDGAERGSATYSDGFKGEHRASFSALSLAFSVEQCSSDAVTRKGKFVSPSLISSTLKGIPPPSCLVASPSFGNSVSSGPSVGNSGFSGKRASGIFDNSAASGLTGMLSISASGPSVLQCQSQLEWWRVRRLPLKEEIMLDQQLVKAFQMGLRHSLDDYDHDAVSVDGRC